MNLSRLAIFGVAAALVTTPLAPAFPQEVGLSSGSVAQIVANLKAGQYVWAPVIAPKGPMLLIVNLKTQRATLYRNGVPIGATTISTGRPGRETPTGVFTILEKQVKHYSSKYDNAPMPYMERLTWQGVALHAGHLPGYPASHGCIRMPAGFAKRLYGETSLGMTVVIAKVASVPRLAPAPRILSDTAIDPDASAGVEWNPQKSPTGPVSIVVSASDGRAVVLRNGVVIGSAPVIIKGPVAGTWAYALKNVDQDGPHWIKLQLSAAPQTSEQVQANEWQRFVAPDAFKKAVVGIVQPGMTIVVTADSLRSAAAPVNLLESGK